MRSTLIFGNGLGMALNPNYFSLKSGLEHVWRNGDVSSPEWKDYIISTLGGVTKQIAPSSEEQLDKLQLAIVATEFLKNIEVDGVEWITPEARKFPEMFRRYIHGVAHYFHKSKCVLPDFFVKELTKHIELTKSHIVTLNYDNLLYDALIRNGVLKGYSGCLIDGFLTSGFNPENLIRRKSSELGWYLHLHGSPLFIDNKKVTDVGREYLRPDSRCHIVLTHFKHKRSIINSSIILSEYWLKFELAMNESDCIMLFGYSGYDDHLNDLVHSKSNEKLIRIVEWLGTSVGGNKIDYYGRKRFWEKKLRTNNFELIRIGSLLNFSDWPT
jgi:hypothetical protein